MTRYLQRKASLNDSGLPIHVAASARWTNSVKALKKIRVKSESRICEAALKGHKDILE